MANKKWKNDCDEIEYVIENVEDDNVDDEDDEGDGDNNNEKKRRRVQ